MTTRRRRSVRAGTLGLYVHIPFCRSRCHYCDFNTYAGLDGLVPAYLVALSEEIAAAGGRCAGRAHPARARARRAHVGKEVDTIYFGGGTPSLLSDRQLAGILDACRRAFNVTPDAEVSVEANPDSATVQNLAFWAGTGVTRVSIGAQTLDDAELAGLGRIHRAGAVAEAVEACHVGGIQDINLDLMFGLPGQDLDSWRRTLEAAVGLGVGHLSCYGLEVAPGTELGRLVAAGESPVANDDEQAAMFELADRLLTASGLRHYEISNYARPGCECRHNLHYWRCEDYLGFGAGAHSCVAGVRWWNRGHPADYIDAVGEGSAVEERERLSRATQLAEAVMLGLRLEDGVDLRQVERRLGIPVGGCDRVYARELSRLAEEEGLLETMAGGVVRLTPSGRLLANEVCSRFMEPDLNVPVGAAAAEALAPLDTAKAAVLGSH